MVFSSLSVVLYTQCQSFFIFNFCGSAELGIYSVSVTLATGFGVLINALITSCYASIFSEPNERQAEVKTGQLLRWVFILSVFSNIILIALGDRIILNLYGNEFISAKEPMIILSFSATLSFMGSVTYRYITHYSGFLYLSTKTTISFLLSLVLAVMMIKRYGIIGAAWSNIIVEFISLTILNYFFKRKSIFRLHLFAIKGCKE
ncbi:oligosaccharide flippase family protein [Klebsiella pneumoniae]